ncbi:MAG: peptidoglycan DD-metalloendopeptidase family protein [Salinibacter sp.]
MDWSVGSACLWAVFLSACLSTAAQAQEDPRAQRESTQQRLQTLEDQIQRQQERLQETAEEAESSQQELEELQREIALREELVDTYQQRLRQLETERRQLRDTLETMQERLATLRSEYQDRARHAYMYSRLPDLALILSARSINQMLVRVRYLQRFAQKRQQQRASVQQAADEVEASRAELAETREETEQLLAEARTERQNLEALESDRQEVVAELRTRRSELQSEIEEKKAQAQQLESQLQALSEEIARRSEAAEDGEGTSDGRRPSEWADLSASFEDNRGELPWPAEGAISEKFGNRVDPVHGTETYHPGILIATDPGREVRSVFQGTVGGVDFVPGYGTYLVIRHGDYLSVYSNFSTLYVSEGETVEAGEVIGEAGTDAEPRGPGLFFAVFDRSENTSVDPTAWLAAQ